MQFDAMRECMQRNPTVFAPLLQDVDTAIDAVPKVEPEGSHVGMGDRQPPSLEADTQ